MTDEASKRIQEVVSVAPKDWDMKPHSLVLEVREFLNSVKDEGTGIDSGTGDGQADLWVTVQGVEYYLTIKRSMKEETTK